MINYLKKDITTVTKGLVIHGCNCSGGFGSGVAGAIKVKWPEVENLFRSTSNPKLGEIYYVEISAKLTVANAYTQAEYGYDGQIYASLTALEEVFTDMIHLAELCGAKDIYLPKIGCGLGGLNWTNQVYPLLNNVDSKGININVCIL